MKLLKPTLIAASVLAATAAFAAGQQSTGTGASVTTYPSPLIGWGTAFDGSDTLGYAHSYDMNVQVLKHHSKVTQRANNRRPRIQIGGELAADLVYAQNGIDTTYRHDLGLSTAKLSFAVDASKMISAYLSVGFDKDDYLTVYKPNTATKSFDTITGPAAPNALAVHQAFVTYGNLNVNPFFVTVGRMYVPFGRYANYMVTDTAPDLLGQTKADAVDLGVMKKGWTVQAYGYQSAHKNASADKNAYIDGGVDLQYQHHFSKGTFTGGVGYLVNMADAATLQHASSTATGSRVGALNVHARFENSKMDLIGSYVAALKKFDSTGVSALTGTNLNGKKPSAVDLQAVYKAHIKSLPWYFGFGYENTKDAGSYVTSTGPMPKSQYTGMVDTNLTKNTALSLQYSYQKLYKGEVKDSANVVEAEFDVYF